jgi:hypothetical protein
MGSSNEMMSDAFSPSLEWRWTQLPAAPYEGRSCIGQALCGQRMVNRGPSTKGSKARDVKVYNKGRAPSQ